MRGVTLPAQAVAVPAMQAGGPRQPSLLRLLSLQDFRRFVPETLGLLLAIMLVRGVLAAGLPAAGPHDAFWIPVLLMAAQYGIMGGLFAACTTSLLVLATDLPLQSPAQDFYEYAAFAAAQPCAWFTAALVLGGLRTLHAHNQARTEDRLEETLAAAGELADRLVGSAREMALLEQRLATDTATTAVLLDAFARIDLSSVPALLASFGELARHAAGAESFTVFLRDGPDLVPRFGLEDGWPLSGAALAALPPIPPGGCGELAGSGTVPDAPMLPVRLPIRASRDAAPRGCLVCTRVGPGQTPAIAARRLEEVCRVLAKLLPLADDAAPGSVPGPGGA